MNGLAAADIGFILTPAKLTLAALLLFAFLATAFWLAFVGLRLLERGLHRLWLRWAAAAPRRQHAACGRLLARLLRREPREWLALLMAATLLFGATLLFLELLDEIFEQDAMARIDQQLFTALQATRSDGLDRLMVAITELGGAWVTVPLGLVVFGWFGWQRRWALAWYWVATFLAARLSLATLKWTLERERPLNIYRGLESFSFPSGHATTAAVIYGFLGFLLARGLPRHWRALVLAAAGVLVAAIGLSRLYLGMHWLSDVIAGVALGLAWITLLAAAMVHFHPPAQLRTGPLAGAALLVIVTAGVLLYQWRLPQTMEFYRQAVPAQVAPG